jgi:gliding motility-associated-like protein
LKLIPVVLYCKEFKMKRVVLLGMILLNFSMVMAQTDSIFWFAIPRITSGHCIGSTCPGGSPAYFRITSKGPTTVNIYRAAVSTTVPLFSRTFTAAGTQSVEISSLILSDPLTSIESGPEDRISDKGILIKSTLSDITVYYDEAEYYNPEIFALKGRNALGTRFYVPSQNLWQNGGGYSPLPYESIDIVATEDNDTVWITPTSNVYKYPSGSYPANVTYFKVLNKGQTYTCRALSRDADKHLGGTLIRSSKPIAVTIKDDSEGMGSGTGCGCYDLLGDQLIPVNILGKNYIVMRGSLNLNSGDCKVEPVEGTTTGERIFIVSTQPGVTTTVNIYGNNGGATWLDPSTITLSNAGKMSSYNVLHNFTYITSNYPIYVYHITGIGCEGGSSVIPKIDPCTGSKAVSFTRSPILAPGSDLFFVNIMATTEAKDRMYLIDESNDSTLINPANFKRVGTTDWWVYKADYTSTSIIQPEKAYQIAVRKDFKGRFHLGVLDGGRTTGGKYGYFSDYDTKIPNIDIYNNHSDIYEVCSGEDIFLHAEGGSTVVWSPGKYLNDSTIFNPIARGLPEGFLGSFTAHMTLECFAPVDLGVQVHVIPRVRSLFTIDTTNLCYPDTSILVTNNSIGSNLKFYWDMNGDMVPDIVTTSKAPFTYIYPRNYGPKSKTYTIHLTTIDDLYGRCSDMMTKTVTVNPEIHAKFIEDKVIGCSPVYVKFTNKSYGDTSINMFRWNFGDGNTSPELHPDHTFTNTHGTIDSIYNVKLVATSKYYCKDSVTHQIRIHPYLEAGFTLDSAYGCADLPVFIINQSIGATNYNWNFGIGAPDITTVKKNYSIPYPNASPATIVYPVKLIVTNSAGACTKTLTRNVTVFPKVHGTFTNTPGFGCNPLSVQFTGAGNVVPSAKYKWTFGDGSSSNLQSPNHLFENFSSNDIPYTVKLVVTSGDLCKDSLETTITVYKRIAANFTVDTAEGCGGFTSTIKNLSSGGISTYDWDFGDGSLHSNSSSPIITHKYNNLMPSTQTYFAKLIVSNDKLCKDSAKTSIKVHPNIDAKFTAGPLQGCNPLTTTFTNTTTLADVFKWEFGDGVSSNNPVSVSHQYVNLTSAEPVIKAKLIAISSVTGCKDTATTNIKVYSYIDANFAINESEICSGSQIAIDNSSPAGATRNSWYFGDGTNILNMNGDDITKTYTNTGSYPDTLKLKLVVKNSHDECSDSLTKNVIVHPQVRAKIIPSDIKGCNPVTIRFYNNSNIPAKKFFWSFDDGTTVIRNDKNYIDHTFSHLNPDSLNFNVKLTAISSFLCDNSDSVLITAYPYLKAGFTMDKSNICSGESIKFSNTSSPGTKYSYWDFNGDNCTEISIDKSISPYEKFFDNYDDATKDYDVLLVAEDAHGCYDSAYLPINIYPKVIPDFNTSDGVTENCNPFTVNFINYSNLAAKEFSWNFDDSTSSSSKDITHEFVNKSSKSRIYNVKLKATSEHLCSEEVSLPITVYPYIDANFKVLNAKICSGDAVKITETTPPGVTFRKWDFDGDGAFENEDTLSGTFTHQYFNKGADSVMNKLTMVVMNNKLCTDTISTPVTVYPEIVSDFTYTQNDDCTPSHVEFKPNISNADIEVYNWTFGDGNTSNIKEPEHDYVNILSWDHKFPVSLYAVSKYKCKSTSWDTVLVRAYIEADFKIPNSNICSGIATLVVDTSLGEVSSRSWRYTQGPYTRTNVSENNFMFLPENNLSSDIINGDLWLTVKNAHGCADSIHRTLSIFPKVLPSFYMDQSEGGCSPYFLQFRNTTKNANDYNWYFGEGGTSTLTDPNHLFYNYTFRDTTYTVKLVAVSDYKCKDSTETVVSIYHKPSAEFSVEKTIDCSPFTVVFKNNSKTTEAPGCFYKWDFNNGSSPLIVGDHDNISRTFLNSGPAIKPYQIVMKASTSRGCLDTTSLTINVYPKVTAMFDTILPGCTPAERQLKNQSVNALYYLWKFENSEMSEKENPNKVFFNTGISDKLIKVELVAESEYGCKDSINHSIEVYPSPVVNFSVNQTLKYYPDATFKFANLTPKGPWIYDWDFDDDKPHLSEADSFDYTYEKWNEYDVKLTASYDKCVDSKVQHIILKAPLPIAAFDSSVIACVPVTVFFKNNSKYGNTFVWEFGDGKTVTRNTTSQVAHTYTEAGIYNVKLTIHGDGGTDYAYQTVEVRPKPLVNFEIKPTEVMLPSDMIRCFNRTQGATRYLWRFGEEGEFGNDVDTLVNPTYKYSKVGTYTVKLIAWSAENCADSSDNIVVQVIAPGVIEFPNAFMPNASGPTGGKYNTTENFVFYPYHEGVAVYHLEIFNRWGELLFISNDVNIGWDGYYKGKLCTQGVYVYKVKGKYLNGSTFVKAGDVTLLYRKGLN